MTVTGRRWLTWVAAALLVLSPLTLLPYFTSSTEVAKLRNAMVFDEAPRSAFDFDPTRWPADFLLDQRPPEAYFVAVAKPLGLESLPDDWSRALAISRHLLTGQPRLVGGAIQAPLQETHRRIVQRGEGYCADFIRVFQALAATAGMPLRAWAFSFDGYGGHGHIVVEIWNRQQQRWQMLDLFNNVYYRGADGQPLAALEVRDGFLRDGAAMNSVPLVPQARAGFRFEDKLRDYYRRGPARVVPVVGQQPLRLRRCRSGALAAIPLPVRWPSWVASRKGSSRTPWHWLSDANAAQRAQMKRLSWQIRMVAGVDAAGAGGPGLAGPATPGRSQGGAVRAEGSATTCTLSCRMSPGQRGRACAWSGRCRRRRAAWPTSASSWSACSAPMG